MTAPAGRAAPLSGSNARRVFQSAASAPVSAAVGRLLQALLLSLTVIVAAAQSALAVPVVSDIAVGDHQAKTRVVLQLSQQVEFTTFILADPHRVVVDLPNVHWTPRASVASMSSAIVTGVRRGRDERGSSRLVIDCRWPPVINMAHLERARGGAFRLVIDIAAAGLPADAATSATASPSGRGTPPTIIGGIAMRPVIGSTGLAVGDIGASAALPAGIGFGTPIPRPHGRARLPVPTWVVAIDPGHGGEDPGAISLHGVHEKVITLAAARTLRDELRSLGRYRVLLTRERDVFIRLRDRIAIARAAGADLFISLHADKVENPAVRGLSVYTLSQTASDAEAAALAEKENRVDLLGGFKLRGETSEVADILINLVQRDSMNQSAQLAALLTRELRAETLLLPRTHRFAGFAVLKSPDVPSVLIELGYLSNPDDERLLRSSQHRQRLARAIARAIDGYFVRFEARNRL